MSVPVQSMPVEPWTETTAGSASAASFEPFMTRGVGCSPFMMRGEALLFMSSLLLHPQSPNTANATTDAVVFIWCLETGPVPTQEQWTSVRLVRECQVLDAATFLGAT